MLGVIEMHSRAEYPYIYFHSAPDIVFVYKIETNDYITISNMHQGGDWSTYKLCDSFEEFNHFEVEPIQGRGYFISMDDLHHVVQAINRYIQKYRDTAKDLHPYHLVSSESGAGALKYSLQSPKKVIGFPDFLAIGPLWKMNEARGHAARFEWLRENINYEDEDFELEEKVKNTLREIEDIPAEAPLYIWYSYNIEEQICLRYFLKLLNKKENDIILIHSNQQLHTSQLEPESLQAIFAENNDNAPLTFAERHFLQEEWNRLTESTEVLHLWKNNEITHVSENYYDRHLMKMLQKLHDDQEKKGFINAGWLLGNMVDELGDNINLFYLEYRLRYLIYSGQLALKGIPKSMRHYSVMLR